MKTGSIFLKLRNASVIYSSLNQLTLLQLEYFKLLNQYLKKQPNQHTIYYFDKKITYFLHLNTFSLTNLVYNTMAVNYENQNCPFFRCQLILALSNVLNGSIVSQNIFITACYSNIKKDAKLRHDR